MTEYLIATSVLEAIVRGAVVGNGRYRLHGGMPIVRRHAAEVSVYEDSCKVVVHLDAKVGESLVGIAAEVRGKVAGTLGPMTGLTVSNVDVVFNGVFSSGS